MQPDSGRAVYAVSDNVSILTRPWGRVQLNATARLVVNASLFQSSPARGGGCNKDDRGNPIMIAGQVSILTRPWGRVQRTQP